MLTTQQFHISPTAPKVIVRGSAVEGHGTFADEMIETGTYVMPLTGKILKRGEFNERDHDLAVLQIDDDTFLLAEGSADDYINHSCNPNLIFSADGLGFIAARDISVGEELSFDYSTCEDDPDWSFMCLCGSPKCRAIVTGFGRLGKNDRARLYATALPYLKRKYKV